MEDILIQPKGTVEIVSLFDDGKVERFTINNKVLRSGRIALTKALANDFGPAFEYFVTGITFGSGGTLGGEPRFIDDTREGLFGPVVTTKSVISSINPDIPTQVTFTSVLTFDEGVGSTINEIALKLYSGDFFSMATFGDIVKTSSIQITLNWRINFI